MQLSDIRRRQAAETVGEPRLPGGRTRTRLASPRALLIYLIVSLALTLPMSALVSIVLNGDSESPVFVVDSRTQGERAVADAQKRLLRTPDDAQAMAQLASGYLQRARETADPTYYAKADGLLTVALQKAPRDAEVLIAAGSLALSRHDFRGAFDLGTRAVTIAPARPAAQGILVDALVELGRDEQALMAAQRMVDLRPDLASFSRVSYLRELHGDLDGAIEAMSLAIQAGAPISEGTAWSDVQLGHLYFAKGDLDGARRAYERADRRLGGYAHAIAGLARLDAARGDLASAAQRYERAVERLPLPEYVGALGDVYLRQGDLARAERQFALVEVERRLFVANGVRVDADLALFDADHAVNLARAVETARAEYAIRPSVHVADILAWAEYRSGDVAGAQTHAAEALRLGSQDPLILYHAGVIAQATGDRKRAGELLGRSAALNPRFSLLWSADLALQLRNLGLEATP